MDIAATRASLIMPLAMASDGEARKKPGTGLTSNLGTLEKVPYDIADQMDALDNHLSPLRLRNSENLR